MSQHQANQIQAMQIAIAALIERVETLERVIATPKPGRPTQEMREFREKVNGETN